MKKNDELDIGAAHLKERQLLGIGVKKSGTGHMVTFTVDEISEENKKMMEEYSKKDAELTHHLMTDSLLREHASEVSPSLLFWQNTDGTPRCCFSDLSPMSVVGKDFYVWLAALNAYDPQRYPQNTLVGMLVDACHEGRDHVLADYLYELYAPHAEGCLCLACLAYDELEELRGEEDEDEDEDEEEEDEEEECYTCGNPESDCVCCQDCDREVCICEPEEGDTVEPRAEQLNVVKQIFCPKCKYDGTAHKHQARAPFLLLEDVVVNRKIYGLTAQGTLVVQNREERFDDEDGKNPRVMCGMCFHEFEIPDDIDFHYED